MGYKMTTIITWTQLELWGLLEDEESRVHHERAVRHLALHPFHLTDLNAALREILTSSNNSYDPKIGGIVLAYKNPKLLTGLGTILYDTSFIHIDVEADFYVFKPRVGDTLKGIVNKKSHGHVGIVVHKTFNATITKADDDENWPGDRIHIGQEVRFTVTYFNLKDGLPYISGALDKQDYLRGCQRFDETVAATKKIYVKPKKSKLLYDDEEEFNVISETRVDDASTDIDNDINKNVSPKKSKKMKKEKNNVSNIALESGVDYMVSDNDGNITGSPKKSKLKPETSKDDGVSIVKTPKKRKMKADASSAEDEPELHTQSNLYEYHDKSPLKKEKNVSKKKVSNVALETSVDYMVSDDDGNITGSRKKSKLKPENSKDNGVCIVKTPKKRKMKADTSSAEDEPELHTQSNLYEYHDKSPLKKEKNVSKKNISNIALETSVDYMVSDDDGNITGSRKKSKLKPENSEDNGVSIAKTPKKRKMKADASSAEDEPELHTQSNLYEYHDKSPLKKEKNVSKKNLSNIALETSVDYMVSDDDGNITGSRKKSKLNPENSKHDGAPIVKTQKKRKMKADASSAEDEPELHTQSHLHEYHEESPFDSQEEFMPGKLKFKTEINDLKSMAKKSKKIKIKAEATLSDSASGALEHSHRSIEDVSFNDREFSPEKRKKLKQENDEEDMRSGSKIQTKLEVEITNMEGDFDSYRIYGDKKIKNESQVEKSKKNQRVKTEMLSSETEFEIESTYERSNIKMLPVKREIISSDSESFVNKEKQVVEKTKTKHKIKTEVLTPETSD